MTGEFQSTFDYIITDAIITSESMNAEVNIALNIVELEIYESLNKPFLTGRLICIDDFRGFDLININGTEVLTITLKQPTAGSDSITKTFILQHVIESRKTNDSAEVLVIRLVEQIFFNNKLISFSKAYAGSGERIIQRILKDHLNVEVDLPSIKSVQEEFKYLAPFITPFEACELVRDRITTKNGLGYYLFSTLNDDNLQLKSLEEMLLENPWNTNRPFVYNQAYVNFATDLTKEQLGFIIENFNQSKVEDSLKFIGYGGYASNFQSTDVTTGKTEKFLFDIKEIIDNLRSDNIITTNNPVLDPKYTFNDIPINRSPSLHIHRVMMNGSYNTDFRNIFEGTQVDKIKLDMINMIIRAALFKSAANITVPGTFFLTGTNRSVGNTIDVFVTNNDVESTIESTISRDKLKDFSRSGKYLIHSAKHSFITTKHKMTVSAVRLEKEEES